MCDAEGVLLVLVFLRYRPFNAGPITGTPFPSAVTGDRNDALYTLPLVSEYGR